MSARLRLERPRQWGACWLTLRLWQSLGLEEFWSERLALSRKGTRFDQVLFVLVAYRLLSPGSEWRLHRHWFERSALGDLAIRPVFHQELSRIEAHIVIAFSAYCVHVTLGRQLKALAPGLTPSARRARGPENQI